MKKVLLFVLSIVTIGLFAGCNLLGLTVDEAKTNLESAGYTVTIIDGEKYVASEDCPFALSAAELEKYLYAEKGDEKIYMYFFFDIDTASFNYDFMHMDDRTLRSGQNNNIIYFGTKQAIKDADL